MPSFNGVYPFYFSYMYVYLYLLDLVYQWTRKLIVIYLFKYDYRILESEL